jgi:hypothetical protein
MIGPDPTTTLHREDHNGAHAVAAVPPVAAGPPALARARRRPNWVLLIGVALGCGLLLGGLAAVASAPLRRAPAVVVTPVSVPAGGQLAPAARGGEEAAGPGARPAGEAASRGGPRAGGGASARAQGVISEVEADTITVNGPDGPVRVRLGETTTVQRLVPAERAALAPGQRVLVAGERAADGTLSAASVQIVGESAPAGAERSASGLP